MKPHWRVMICGTMETSKAPDEKITSKGVAVLGKLAKLAAD